MTNPQDNSGNKPIRFRNFGKLGIEKTEQIEGPFESQKKALKGGRSVTPTPKQSMATIDTKHAELVVASQAWFSLHEREWSRNKRIADRIHLGVSLSVVAGGMITVWAAGSDDMRVSVFALCWAITATFASIITSSVKYSDIAQAHANAKASWSDIQEDLVWVPGMPTTEQRGHAVSRLEGKAMRLMKSDTGAKINDDDLIAMENQLIDRKKYP